MRVRVTLSFDWNGGHYSALTAVSTMLESLGEDAGRVESPDWQVASLPEYAAHHPV